MELHFLIIPEFRFNSLQLTTKKRKNQVRLAMSGSSVIRRNCHSGFALTTSNFPITDPGGVTESSQGVIFYDDLSARKMTPGKNGKENAMEHRDPATPQIRIRVVSTTLYTVGASRPKPGTLVEIGGFVSSLRLLHKVTQR